MRRLLPPIAVLLASTAPLSAQQLGPRDLDTMAVTQPTAVIHYGSDSLQFGELRLPPGNGPFPIAVIIHGGCWRAEIANLRNSAPVASALPPEGIATWNIEYRRLGNRGGGWPGTFTDVGAAIDYLRTLASKYPLDLTRVVLVGHSAGAHLAAWAAARPRLPAASPIRGADPLRVRAAVPIDGPMDLAPWVGRDAQVCGQEVIAPLMGGPPADQPDHYREGSPAQMLPLGVPLYLVFSRLLTPAEAEAYQTRARSAGDSVVLVPVPNANHFQVIAPAEPAWIPVRQAIRNALGQTATALPSVSLPSELDRVLRDYEREWSARSSAGLAQLFTEDGFVLQSGRPPVRGRAGIAQAYQGAGGPLALRALAYATADTVGYIVGAYASDAGAPDIGKFILLVRRERGGPWRIAADMDNGNRAR